MEYREAELYALGMKDAVAPLPLRAGDRKVCETLVAAPPPLSTMNSSAVGL